MNRAIQAPDAPVKIDPITLEVIRFGVVSITNQIDANITRTAFSPYVYEYKDFAVGLVDVDGQLVAQSTGGMPPFVADAVGTAVRDGLKTYGRFHDGDVVLCNHAAVQGQHLNNTVMYTPIYAGPDGATLLGFFAINVHWIDIGGVMHGSTDIFMEGLQLRSIKLWSKGEPIEEIYRIIENNTRMPVDLMGDISAQLAGCFLGRDLTLALASKYGIATFFAAVETILEQGEASSRARIREIPDGVYESEAFLDDDSLGTDPVPIGVKVIVEGEELTVDFSGLSDQVPGPLNSGYFGRRRHRGAGRLQVPDRAEGARQRRRLPPAQADPAGGKDPERPARRADGRLSVPVAHRHRFGDPLSRRRPAAPCHRRPFRHPFGLPGLRQLGRWKALPRP